MKEAVKRKLRRGKQCREGEERGSKRASKKSEAVKRKQVMKLLLPALREEGSNYEDGEGKEVMGCTSSEGEKRTGEPRRRRSEATGFY